jgi:hypothetical protein
VEELVDADRSQHQSFVVFEGVFGDGSAFIADQRDRFERQVVDRLEADGALTGGEDVAAPVGSVAEGQGNEEPVRCRRALAGVT